MRTKIGLKNEIKCWEINSKEKNYKRDYKMSN